MTRAFRPFEPFRPFAGLTQRGGGAAPVPAFDPATLFGASDQGGVYDFTDESNLFQDDARTVALTAPGDPLFGANDLSGKGNHITRHAGTPRWQGMPATWGANLFDSPLFEDGGDWATGTGWSISGAVATKTAGTASALEQGVTLEAGKTYMCVVRIATRTAGTVKLQLAGGTTVTHASGYNAAGEYFEMLTAVSGNTTAGILADATFAGTIKAMQIREVLSFYDMGVRGDFAERLRTGPIDMSGSNEMTIVVSVNRARRVGNMLLGQVAATATGNGERIDQTGAGIGFTGRDGTNTDLVVETDADLGPQPGGYTVFALRRDTNETDATAQRVLQFSGISLSQSNTGGPLISPTANPSTARINLLSWINNNSQSCATIYRVLVINRRLTDEELAQAVAWCGQKFVAGAILGDSTWASDGPARGVGRGVTSNTYEMLAGFAPILSTATWGHDTTEQNAAWSALTSPAIGQIPAVVIATGLNDIAGRVDGGATVPQILADLQSLIDEVKADCPNAVIIGHKLHDVRTWLDGRTNAEDCIAAHAAWNTALTDGTITGLNAVSEAHLALMNDGTGYMPDLVGTGPDGVNDGVHPGEYGRYCMNVALRQSLVSLGIAEPARTFP